MSTQDSRWQSSEWCSYRALELFERVTQPSLEAELNAFLDAEKDHRLGARFERLIEFGLNYLPGFDCVRRRLQVQAEGRTRGEFDFIVRDTLTGQLEHWEVASKFYLGVHRNGQMNWVGPGKRDSLLRKLRHLTEVQLKLANLPESQQTQQELGAQLVRVRALLKGRLFSPLGVSGGVSEVAQNSSPFSYEDAAGTIELNQNAPHGYWCDIEQFAQAKIDKIYALEKQNWLDPESDKCNEWDVDMLASAVQKGPQCVDVVTQDQQQQRWFVVSPGWFDDLDLGAVS